MPQAPDAPGSPHPAAGGGRRLLGGRTRLGRAGGPTRGGRARIDRIIYCDLAWNRELAWAELAPPGLAAACRSILVSLASKYLGFLLGVWVAAKETIPEVGAVYL